MTEEQTTTDQATRDEGASESGRARVRRLLIDPLTDLGFRRPGNMSAEVWKDTLAKMADRLAYLSEDRLEALHDAMIRFHGAKSVWPRPSQIIHYAWVMQLPPPRDNRYSRSIVRSAMGRAARDGGYLVELFQIAKRMGPPPAQYVITKLRDEARANRAKRARIAEYIERGVCSPEDARWLSEYHADLAEAEAILDDAMAEQQGDAT